MKLIALTLLTAALWAQEATPPPKPAPSPATSPRPVTRVMEFILDDGLKMQQIAALFAHRLHRIQVEPAVGLLVMTGSEADVNEVEAAIKRYYKPKPLEAGISGPANRNFEIILHVLYAKSEGNEVSVSASMQPVVQQLKLLTNLTSFRSIETQVLRVRSGEKIESNAILQWPEALERSSPQYQFRTTVRPKGVLIQCDNLHFSARTPYATGPDSFQYRETGFSTSVDLKPGQATVIGKSNASPKDGAIIAVLTAKFVD